MRLGEKKSLEGQIHKITGIPVSALQGSPLLISASTSECHGQEIGKPSVKKTLLIPC
jgi:hypothetical protein